MVDDLKPFERALLAAWPHDAWRDVPVLVAVSGGADSMALLRAMASIAGRDSGQLIVGHVNHGLRGAESTADAEFVREAAAALGLRCEIGEANVAGQAALDGDGIEAAARTVRYAWLAAYAARIGARYIATAHTADDRAETILHRIVRGTGLAGLAGIRRLRVLNSGIVLVRPILDVRRTQVLEYLEAVGQPFRVDASNADPRYTRNRLRNELLPELAASYNPQVVDALLRLGDQAADAHTALRSLGERHLKARLTLRGGTATIDCRGLADEPRQVVREMFRALWQREAWPEQGMTFSHWDALAGLAMEPAGGAQFTLPGEIYAERHEERLSVSSTRA